MHKLADQRQCAATSRVILTCGWFGLPLHVMLETSQRNYTLRSQIAPVGNTHGWNSGNTCFVFQILWCKTTSNQSILKFKPVFHITKSMCLGKASTKNLKPTRSWANLASYRQCHMHDLHVFPCLCYLDVDWFAMQDPCMLLFNENRTQFDLQPIAA